MRRPSASRPLPVGTIGVALAPEGDASLRAAQSIWLLRRAEVLGGGTFGDAVPDARDLARAALLRRLAERVTDAVGRRASLTLSPAERAVLFTEAQALTSRAAHEMAREGAGDLRQAEESLLTARAFRELLAATSPQCSRTVAAPAPESSHR